MKNTMKNSTRLLQILKCLLEYTDESHSLTISEINDYLLENDLSGDRKTISGCIGELQTVGYDIKCVRKTQNHYYINKRDFSFAEVKLLVDAIQSSHFIPTGESQRMIEKLAGLVGEHKGEILKRQLYVESRSKADTLELTHSVEIIHEAITREQKISFQYFDYNPNKEKVLRYDGWTYSLSPYVLVWNNDQYYIVGYSDKYQDIVKYRLDRMTNIEILEEASTPKPEDFDVSDFFDKEFSMLQGETTNIELLCENKLMGSIIDKFGKDVCTEIVDADHFKVTTEVSLSGNFYGWVFASSGAMRILAPGSAVAEFKEIVQKY